MTVAANRGLLPDKPVVSDPGALGMAAPHMHGLGGTLGVTDHLTWSTHDVYVRTYATDAQTLLCKDAWVFAPINLA